MHDACAINPYFDVDLVNVTLVLCFLLVWGSLRLTPTSVGLAQARPNYARNSCPSLPVDWPNSMPSAPLTLVHCHHWYWINIV